MRQNLKYVISAPATRLLTTLMCVTSLQACRHSDSSSAKSTAASASSLQAVAEGDLPQVSQAVVDKAWSIISGLSYMPLWHASTGCDQRAVLAGEELAAAGIAAYNIIATPAGSKRLDPKVIDQQLPFDTSDGVEWTHHTVVALRSADATMVFDNLQSTAPMTVEDWLANMGVTRADLDDLSIMPFTVQSAPHLPGRIVSAGSDVASFPVAADGTAQNICNSVASQYFTSGLSKDQIKTAVGLLDQMTARATTLSQTLTTMGLFADTTPFSGSDCNDVGEN